jgi:hypothetical protein
MIYLSNNGYRIIRSHSNKNASKYFEEAMNSKVPLIFLLFLLTSFLTTKSSLGYEDSSIDYLANRGILFGIRGLSNNEHNFVQIDTTNAQTKILSNIGGNNFAFNSHIALNPIDKEIYVIRHNMATEHRALIAIDLETNQASERFTVNVGYLFLFFDTNTRSLFAVKGLENNTNNFVKINPIDGSETIISNVGGQKYGFYSRWTFNSHTREIYLLRQNMSADESPKLIAINLQTGQVSERGKVENGFIVLQYDSVSKTLFGITGLENDANNLVKINPLNASQTIVSKVGDRNYLFSDKLAFNPTDRELYILRRPIDQEASRLVAINIDTGQAIERGLVDDGFIAMSFYSLNTIHLPFVGN